MADLRGDAAVRVTQAFKRAYPTAQAILDVLAKSGLDQHDALHACFLAVGIFVGREQIARAHESPPSEDDFVGWAEYMLRAAIKFGVLQAERESKQKTPS